MNEEEIISKVNNAVSFVVKQTKEKKDLLGLHDLYSDSVEMAEHISYHAVKGVFPEKIFKYRSPNQTEAEAKYIRENYKQYTLPLFVDYISTITRPFGDGNWDITYRDNDDFKEYVTSKLPIYGSLENFIKYVVPSVKTIDANGFIAVRPRTIETITSEEGEVYVDDTKKFEPTPFVFESKSVIDYEENEYYLFLSKEKTKVKYNSKIVKEGLLFELYTKDAVFFIEQIGDKTDWQFQTREFYRHDLNTIPVTQLKGIPHLKGDEILWQSPFLYTVDLLDVVTMNANWLQASINKCVYPHIVMFGSVCDYKDSNGISCNYGKLLIEGVSHTCPSCNGQGIKSRLSPLGTLLLNPSSKFDAGEVQSSQEPLKFVSPDVTTLQYIGEKIEADLEKARKILHLQTSNSQVKGSENMTATGMGLDNKAMYSFVKPISDQIFDIYYFCLEMTGLQRDGKSFVVPELNYPKTFDFKSAEDYLIDISNAISNNLPPSFIQVVLYKYISSYYGDGNEATKVFSIIANADRLFGMTNEEINIGLAKGTISNVESIIHSSILYFIKQLQNEDANFLDKELSFQIEAIKSKAIEKEQEIVPESNEEEFPIA